MCGSELKDISNKQKVTLSLPSCIAIPYRMTEDLNNLVLTFQENHK